MDLPGFQVARAIRQIGGDAALYRKMLHLFSEDYRDIQQTLRQKRKEGDAAELRRLVHNLKGLAGNLGAERLARAAVDLESGWNQKPSMDEDSFESFLLCLQETLDTVRLWAYQAAEKESMTASAQGHKPATEKSENRSQLPCYLGQLKEQLHMGHFQALDILRKIRSLMTEEEFDADWQQLLLQIENYDYDDASDLLSVIERRLSSAPESEGSCVTPNGI
jgi:HPt (histidine-containing phosphotransfer) domain-containing protein